MAFNQSDALFEQSTDTNGNFGNSVSGQANSFFLPKVYSKQVLNFFRKASVVEAITNTDYAGEIAAYALRDAFDAGVLASMFAGVSASSPDHILGADATATTAGGVGQTTASIDLTGSDGTGSDPLDVMARMARLLDEQNIPEEGRWFVGSPDFYEALSQSSSKLLSVDYNAGQGSIRNGLVSSGKLRGFNMYKTNNIAATSTATGKCLAGHMSSTATAQTITSTEVIRDPSSFGDIVRGLHVYGAKVLRPEALVSAFFTID